MDRIEGQLRLTVDLDARTASFSQVDAVVANDEAPPRTLDVNDAFNMTDLAGTVGEDRSIRFVGTAPDGSDVVVTLTFRGALVHLLGNTTPPASSDDFFVLNLDALAQREYAGNHIPSNVVYASSDADCVGGLYSLSGRFLSICR